ncbi:hypothetical protein HDU87_006070 [Geranomyces variabilis]|uniref:CsbD-like domain-containing protein n=1 Tax=Geranomyces variabilis TaxID=109894 RepID=A0AAD5TIB3_9FUNG|nr:hypothetical protein HDU87_006070 [Geranomyces variabilis]
MSSSTNAASNAEPSLLHGHVQYVKGTVESTVGQMLNAPTWTEAGTRDKMQGEAEMHAADQATKGQQAAANASRENKSLLEKEGKVEGLLGKVAACPGMESRGQDKIAASHQ